MCSYCYSREREVQAIQQGKDFAEYKRLTAKAAEAEGRKAHRKQLVERAEKAERISWERKRREARNG